MCLASTISQHMPPRTEWSDSAHARGKINGDFNPMLHT